MILNKKKRIYRIVDFVLPVDHRSKLKENEKKDKYQDLTRYLVTLRNMKVTVIPIVIDAIGTVTKRLVYGLEDLDISRADSTIVSQN